MLFARHYVEEILDRAAIDGTPGLLVVEFGTDWCGHCQAAQPVIETLLAARDDIAHLKIEDGKGRPLGRSFRVKHWPTLILLRDGDEIARVARPTTARDVKQAMDLL